MKKKVLATIGVIISSILLIATCTMVISNRTEQIEKIDVAKSMSTNTRSDKVVVLSYNRGPIVGGTISGEMWEGHTDGIFCVDPIRFIPFRNWQNIGKQGEHLFEHDRFYRGDTPDETSKRQTDGTVLIGSVEEDVSTTRYTGEILKAVSYTKTYSERTRM